MNRSVLRKFRAGKFSNCLSTWSALANAFNRRPMIPRGNVDLISERTGLFTVSELSFPEGFHSLEERCIDQTIQLVREASSDERSRKMVVVFDELSDSICKVADLAEFIRLAHPIPTYTEAALSACGVTSRLVEKLNTDKKLYDALKNVITNGDKVPTNEVDKHVAELFLFDFEQSGIHLPDDERYNIVALTDNILQLGQKFVAASDSPRIIKRNFIPEFARKLFRQDGDKIVVQSLNADSVNPVIRELSYRVFLHPDPQQEKLLIDLLKTRHELAVACGFPTFAHRALKGSVLQSPNSVMEFLNILSRSIKRRAEEDFKVMALMKQLEYPSSGPLAVWDVPFYTNKVKREKFDVINAEYSPYFSLGACMEGLNMLMGALYGITLENSSVLPGEVWVDDVYKLAVRHEEEGVLGYIYCDFYERTGKPNQDCHFTIRGGKNLPDGSYQEPVVVLMLNLPMPRWSGPPLLSPGMVDNLFHEMGHAMHSMLARTKYQHVTGTRCSTDFAEVPSVLMEYFASDPRVIKKFARHFQTNKTIPDEMLEKLCASKNLFMASEMQLQIFYSVVDQLYHGSHPLKGTTTEVLAEVQNTYYSLAYVPYTAWQLRFGHLVGYGAKYYSYLVSKALASWIWQTYFEMDPFDRAQGERYRRECLAHGGGKPPYELVTDFIQREPTPSLLVEALVKEIDTKHEKLDCLKDIYKKIQ